MGVPTVDDEPPGEAMPSLPATPPLPPFGDPAAEQADDDDDESIGLSIIVDEATDNVGDEPATDEPAGDSGTAADSFTVVATMATEEPAPHFESRPSVEFVAGMFWAVMLIRYEGIICCCCSCCSKMASIWAMHERKWSYNGWDDRNNNGGSVIALNALFPTKI